jgi:O-antigen biosynthesis protein
MQVKGMSMNKKITLNYFSAKMHAKGKFLYCGEEKFYIKGVTYGTFKPNNEGSHFPEREIIEKDFTMMILHGINCIRTYTVPPTYLLDLAEHMNLKVMVGLPWEQHITFLDDAERRNNIIKNVQENVLQCDNHAAILCYTIGNEIPAPIVRWYGKKKIENFLKQLYKAVKQIDKDALVTYVNYPTTEYLDLHFLDFDCFNVYLETPKKLGKYLSRLHNLSGHRPLVLAEIGLDSYRNGKQKQAETLAWQIETVFAKGCAGMFVFAWTDEWWRGGADIEDWDFGLVDRQRNPKPALFAVSMAMDNIPFSSYTKLPAITVIVCSYNGSATIQECIEGILKIDYPNFDVVVVDDGSTDNLAEIVSQYPVKLISTSNRGLSSARNTGMYTAQGEIIAYIDDDAYPDPHWLLYLAYAYLNSDHACIGGPNIAPYDDPFISTCVANAPGGPVHVLETDEIAEHVPGCNMSFRKDALMKIGGFDPVFRNAGDDVDVCWRIQQSGRTIGFHPSVAVWHHRRNSFKAYWKQQKGYGKAEALLEAKWPEKYNSLGHLTWAGRIYGNGFTLPVKMKKDKIFHGTWGSALFQSVYQPGGSFINSIPLMPEWYLLSASLAILGSLGFLWHPLLWVWPAFAVSIAIVIIQAVLSAKKNSSLRTEQKNYKYTLFIILLHMIQPVARLYGRFSNGLTPWRKRGAGFNVSFLIGFRSRVFSYWSEEWKSSEEWLTLIENNLKDLKARIKRGNDFDNWDIQVKNGLFSKGRGLLVIEEHGAGKQYLKFKCTVHSSVKRFVFPLTGVVIATFAFLAHQYIVGGIITVMIMAVTFQFFIETARSMNSLSTAFKAINKQQPQDVIKVIKKEKINAELNEVIHLQHH